MREQTRDVELVDSWWQAVTDLAERRDPNSRLSAGCQLEIPWFAPQSPRKLFKNWRQQVPAGGTWSWNWRTICIRFSWAPESPPSAYEARHPPLASQQAPVYSPERMNHRSSGWRRLGDRMVKIWESEERGHPTSPSSLCPFTPQNIAIHIYHLQAGLIRWFFSGETDQQKGGHRINIWSLPKQCPGPLTLFVYKKLLVRILACHS